MKDILLDLLAEKWVAWNKKEITGNEFAHQFTRLFPKETNLAWRKSLKKRILESSSLPPESHEGK